VFVDPEVSRAKFQREVGEFREQAEIHHRRGIWLIDATFPNVFVVLVAVKPKPFPMVAFGVLINFENYDVEPLSVQLVHPVTRVSLKKHELAHRLQRAKPIVQNGQIVGMQMHEIVQGWDEAMPFVCLQGVREYHKHPAHTGDSWWLYRKSGYGRLSHLLNVLATYGIDPIQFANVQLQPQITGFVMAGVPT
jgi:hypothetical protein